MPKFYIDLYDTETTDFEQRKADDLTDAYIDGMADMLAYLEGDLDEDEEEENPYLDDMQDWNNHGTLLGDLMDEGDENA